MGAGIVLTPDTIARIRATYRENGYNVTCKEFHIGLARCRKIVGTEPRTDVNGQPRGNFNETTKMNAGIKRTATNKKLWESLTTGQTITVAMKFERGYRWHKAKTVTIINVNNRYMTAFDGTERFTVQFCDLGSRCKIDMNVDVETCQD